MERYRIVEDPETGEAFIPVRARGQALTQDPILNKGTAFPEEERDGLELRGVLPPAVSTIERQLERVLENYRREPDDLARYLYLIALQDRNETLFYRLLLEHLEEMLPIVYTPTVGQACERYSHLYRRARGLYLNRRDVGRMAEVLRNAPYSEPDVIVATDAEGILGIGDQGIGGMGIPIGKLTLYTAGAGVHPARCLPIMLDVGTNNPELRGDPLYLGDPRPRLQGDEYFGMLDAFVDAIEEVFPGVLLQWEDFSRQKAWSVLERYRDRVCSFNDDIQGTGAVTLAGILGVAEITGRPLRDQRFCVYGAGAGGGGIIHVILAALQEEGLDRREALGRITALDSRGLILLDRSGLEPFKTAFAREAELVSSWDPEEPGRIGLHDVVRNFRPTVLIGAAGQPGTFDEEIVREMAAHVDRPGIFALSNPTSKTEVHPADALAWTGGRALVATGSPFPPVETGDRVYEIGQCNNLFCFPGIGIGVVASGAREVNDAMLLAAARTVAAQVGREERRRGRLYPSVSDIREISREVARAVGRAAAETGAVPGRRELAADALEARIERASWYPEYVSYRPVEE